MKLLFLASLALADPLIEPREGCNRIEGNHGETTLCSESHYVTGLCTSAKSTQCGNNGAKSHEYICCDDIEIQPHRHCYNLYGHHGTKMTCTNPNDVNVGGCNSGKDANCPHGLAADLAQYEQENRAKSFQVMKCCQSGLVLQRCNWRYGHHGEMVKCQNGDVAHGQCSSGQDANCKTEANLKKYTGLYCCDVRR